MNPKRHGHWLGPRGAGSGAQGEDDKYHKTGSQGPAPSLALLHALSPPAGDQAHSAELVPSLQAATVREPPLSKRLIDNSRLPGHFPGGCSAARGHMPFGNSLRLTSLPFLSPVLPSALLERVGKPPSRWCTRLSSSHSPPSGPTPRPGFAVTAPGTTAWPLSPPVPDHGPFSPRPLLCVFLLQNNFGGKNSIIHSSFQSFLSPTAWLAELSNLHNRC